MVVPIGFKDESERLSGEFRTLIDPRLRDILLGSAIWLNSQCGETLIVTSIGRTADENRAVGGLPYSAHLIRTGQFVRACDLRVFNMPGDTASRFVERIKKMYPSTVHILKHNSGAGDHIHININRIFAIPYDRTLL